MNFERLRWGEWIAGIAALVLVLVTFRAWYEVSGSGVRVTAWDALTSGRYLLLATAAIGILLLLLTAAEQTDQMSLPFGYIAALVGLGCTVYIAYRLATPPADSLDASRGLYFGLAAAAGVAAGGLLAAREPSTYTAPRTAEALPEQWGATGSTDLGFQDPAESAHWSPGAPAPGLSAGAVVPPATTAGARGAGAGAGGGLSRPIEAGDEVALTAGGARFPAGTIARIVQVFGGGALVEVTAPDGLAERFEVPEEAYERVGAGGAAAPVAEPPTPATSPSTAGQDWSPAMPEPAGPSSGEDWGFDESAAAGAGSAAAAGAAVSEPEAPAEPAEKKVPFWKREIGGKKDKGETAEAPAVSEDGAEAGEEKPGFLRRVFGGGGAKPEDESTEVIEEAAPAAAVAEPEPPAPEPEPPAPEPEPEPPAPEPPAPEPEPEPPAPEPEPPAPEPEPTPEPEPAASAAEAAAPEPEAAAEEEAPKPKPKPRRKSSATRKVPKEAVEPPAGKADAPAEADAQPKVGDQVQLKVSGGGWDAGTRGTVVDVFSAGVIVEVIGDDGKTERLDLPFEAVGPADGA